MSWVGAAGVKATAGVGVVDFAADRRGAASGESAVLVSGLKVSAHRRRDSVGVDGEHRPGDRVGDEPLPRGRRPGEEPCGRGVDGGASDEVAGFVRTREREGGDDDLDAGPDRAERPCDGVAGVVEGGRAREEEVGENVGTDLVGGPGVGGDHFAPVASVHLAAGRVTFTTCPGRSIRTVAAGVDDRPRHLGQPIVHALDDRRRQRRDQI